MKKHSLAIFIILFMTFLLRNALLALDPERNVTQYVIDTWNSESGLPTNSITTILQTSDGYLWLGTEEGLLRFDGVSFTTFDESNTPEITDNYINCLYEDSNKNLWIGIRNGSLIQYKNGFFKRYTDSDGFSFSTNRISCIFEEPPGTIWIGTEILFKFQDNKFTTYAKEKGLSSKVKVIYKDSKDNLWIGTYKGLFRLEDNKFSNYGIEGLPLDTHIMTLYEDRDGNLWIGTAKGLFLKQNGDNEIISSSLNVNFPQEPISAICEDKDNNLWIGTYTKGLFRYRSSDGAFANLSKTDGLSDDTIRSVKGDAEGNIWIGSAFGGLSRLRGGKFKVFGVNEGLADDVVFAVTEDRKHYLWIGTNKGLTRLKANGKESLNFNDRNGLANAVVNTIFEDRDGFIWVGTDNHGLNQLQSYPSKIEKIKQYPLEGKVLAIAEDITGSLWGGTSSGLFKKEKNSAHWQKITLDINDGLGEYFNHVNMIYVDSKKNVWFSAYELGLVKYSNGSFTVYNKERGLVSSSFQCIYEDNDEALWLGTINGLSRFKNGQFTHFTMKDGLFNNNIYKILADNKGNFWFSCNKGIFSVIKKDLDDYAEKKIVTLLCNVYGKDDGMRSSECNGGYQTAGCKSNDGKLWFPTMKGVVIIDPENPVINELPPPVVIERVLLDGVPTAQGGEIEVKPGSKRIDFRYTGLSFNVPKRVKFKYRLVGYNEEWTEAGNLRLATYTNLNAGTYRFQVTACNEDGKWSEQGAAVSFTVIPPFVETWLFRILALTGFAIISYLVINFINRYLSLVNFWNKQKYVGKFKLLAKIGTGGMGTVYKAENTLERGKKVAIKVLREELFEDEKNRKRFKQEAAIIDQLDHPNIIKVYERGQSNNSMYIAMELLEGKTLTKKITDEGPLDLFDSLHIMSQVTEAIAKIHSKNIIHRDMKPDNVMLVENGDDSHFVKLLDFGLAKMEHQTRLTQTGMVIGTINYMAPEQIAGTSISSAADIYSIGVMFYEMLTGLKPFIGETSIDVMKEIIEKYPVEPIKYRPDIPLELNNLILRMMEKKKIERPAAEEVLNHLQIIHTKVNT